MSERTSPGVQLSIAAILILSLLTLAVQSFAVRPYLWPGGAGIALSGDTVFASLAEPRPVPRIRPPHAGTAAGSGVTVLDVHPSAPAAPHVTRGDVVTGIATASGTMVALDTGLPASAADVLRVWRDVYTMGPSQPLRLQLRDAAGRTQVIDVARPPGWQATPPTRGEWLRRHAGPVAQVAAFLLGATILVVLGTRGLTASLMTLALIATGVANAGPLYGAEFSLPVVGPLLLVFAWLVTPLAFPVIGLAVLNFPSRARVLETRPWIQPVLIAIAAPMFFISVLAALFLLGVDTVLPLLAWVATHGWIFDASFALALSANVLIVIEGVARYRTNLDANERRRIQIVVYTGVPAVFAYAIKTGVPVLASIAGWAFAWPWLLEAALQAIVLAPAFALPYAVAVKHVFSPRTVLRRSLQYALAKRTLSVLVMLPVAALALSLYVERDRPIGDVLFGQPLFYGGSLLVAALVLRYRLQAQQWLDRRFFRAEYDAREILVALANRVPIEHDPAELVGLVLARIDSALHPESMAVLAGDDGPLELVGSLRSQVSSLRRETGLATVLRWSDEPLEVFLDDDRSATARLPPADRAWMADGRVALLVPMSSGSGDARSLIGVLVLGQKRSEERYTREDRRLLSGIAAQMSVALDLSRLRRRAATPSAEHASAGAGPRRSGAPESALPLAAATMPPALLVDTVATPARPSAFLLLGTCPMCRRCFSFDAARGADGSRCADDGAMLSLVTGVPPVVDGKYRMDAFIGRGGMGAVFRARDLRLDRDVAIKTVNAELVADASSLTRFQREAQIVARLQHPAIVTIFDYGSFPHGAAFLVMEFVAGEDLRHLLAREKTLAVARTLALMEEVASGIDAAHRAGILHRDLKPENILLPASGSGAKVLDFGVAKLADASGSHGGTLTHAATIVGTPAYMAPEQLRGESLDARADVYSLAVVTYELLTGQLPFGSGSFFDIGLRQAAGPRDLAFPGVPEHIAGVLRRALSATRDERPASALELTRALVSSSAPPTH